MPLLWDATRGLPTTAGSPRPLLACGVGGPNWSDGSVAVLLPCRRSPPTRTRRTGRHLFLLSYRRCTTVAISDGADRRRWPTVVAAVTETATAHRETETCYRAVNCQRRASPSRDLHSLAPRQYYTVKEDNENNNNSYKIQKDNNKHELVTPTIVPINRPHAADPPDTAAPGPSGRRTAARPPARAPPPQPPAAPDQAGSDRWTLLRAVPMRVAAQMWAGRAQSRRRCGRGGHGCRGGSSRRPDGGLKCACKSLVGK